MANKLLPIEIEKCSVLVDKLSAVALSNLGFIINNNMIYNPLEWNEKLENAYQEIIVKNLDHGF